MMKNLFSDKNKKGQGALIGSVGITVALIVIVLVTVFLLSFSNKIRFLLIGIVLFIALFFVLIRGEMTPVKGVAAIILFILSMFFLFGTNLLQEQFPGAPSTDTVYKPQWGSLGCIKDDYPTKIEKYVDQGYTFTCGGDAVVDDCEVWVNCIDSDRIFSGSCDGKYKINDGESVAYNIKQGETIAIVKLTTGQKIDFNNRTGFFGSTNTKWTKINYIYYPYRLWTEEGGAHWLTRSSDCCLANQDEVEKFSVEYGDWECLTKDMSKKYKNYITDWVPTVGEVYNYQGRDVVCGNNILYAITPMKMGDGITYKFQGDIIKGVECCPYQTNNCDSKTFTFLPEDESEERECTFDYQCENGGVPEAVSDSKATQEYCSTAGKCISETIPIECGSDARCKELYGNEYVCDLSFANYGNCIKGGLIPQPFCGDKICQTGETYSNCPSDCKQDEGGQDMCNGVPRKWYQEAYTKEINDWGTLGWRHIFNNPKVHTESGCRISAFVYILVILASVVIIAVTAILSKLRKKKSYKSYKSYKKGR